MHGPVYMSKTIGLGDVQPSVLSSSILYLGSDYLENKESLKGTVFKTRLQGLDAWFEEENQRVKKISRDITNLKFSGLTITFRYDGSNNTDLNSSVSSANSETLVSLEEFQNGLHRAVTFLSFATGKILQQGKTQLTNGSDTWDLYYKPAFFSERKQTFVTPLFRSGEKDLQQKFDKWNKVYDDFLPLIVLYFLPKINKIDTNTDFILKAQLIEALHRKLERKNEMVYNLRIKNIVSRPKYTALLFPAQSQDSLSKLCKNITSARNYFTHYSQKGPPEAASPANLPFLTFKLETIIDLYLLDKIGFDKAYFEKIKHSIINDKFTRQRAVGRFLERKQGGN